MLMLFVTNWDFLDLVNFPCANSNSLPMHACSYLYLKVLALIAVLHMVKEVAQYISAMLDVREMNLP